MQISTRSLVQIRQQQLHKFKETMFSNIQEHGVMTYKAQHDSTC